MRKDVADIVPGDFVLWEGIPREVLLRHNVWSVAMPGYEFTLKGMDGVLHTGKTGWLEIVTFPNLKNPEDIAEE